MTWPLKNGVVKYWCSGYRGDDNEESALCALVEAEGEGDAKRKIRAYWPEAKEWRFCEEKEPGWIPGDRFSMKDTRG